MPGAAGALSLYAAIRGLVLVGIGFALGWWVRSPASDPSLHHAAAVVVAAKAERAAAVDQVQLAGTADRAAGAAADTLRAQVVVLDPTTLAIQDTPDGVPELVTVPPLIVARVRSLEVAIAAKDAHIATLQQLIVADSSTIHALEDENKLLKEHRGRRCGAVCGAIFGAATLKAIETAVRALAQTH